MKNKRFIRVALCDINEKFSFNTLLLALAISIMFVSCTGKKSAELKPLNLKPTKLKLVNENSDYFQESMRQNSIAEYIEIIDNTYSLIPIKSDRWEGGELQIDVKFKSIKKANKDDVFKISNSGYTPGGTGLYLVDNVGTIIEEWGGNGQFELVNKNVLADFLMKGDGDCMLRFTIPAYRLEKYIKTPENLLGFVIITSAYRETAAGSNSQSKALSSTDKEEVTTESSNQDWDKVLTDYESYTDKYIKLLKKSKAGDMSAMNEYVGMLEKAQELQESLSEASNDMTPAQMQKFMKIQTKLLNAASEL